MKRLTLITVLVLLAMIVTACASQGHTGPGSGACSD